MTGKLAKPTARQKEWMDAELGVIIHLDVQVFENTYNWRDKWGYTPDPGVFNPSALDTDQWIKAASDFGAKYAILVAKHCSGFSLWPTKAHSYSVASSPWKNGKGDIVADFIASCRKYGVKPGIYCSASANAYMRVDLPGRVVGGTPEDNRKYAAMVEQQLSELWGNYGPLFEVWFDGGVLPPEQGGPRVAELQQKFQRDAIVFSGPRGCLNRIRHGGAENGTAVLPAWATSGADHQTSAGDPDGDEFIPIECDLPNRKSMRSFQGGWFWHEKQDSAVYPVTELVDRYYKSVGRNANFLIGMVIDNRGLFPDRDRQVFEKFGRVIRRINELPHDTASGTGFALELPITKNEMISEVLLREDFSDGERIRKYTIDAFSDGAWKTVFEGEGVGHKRLIQFPKIRTERMRLRILESVGEPVILEFSAYFHIPLFQPPKLHRDKSGLIAIDVPPESEVRYTLDGSEPGAASALYTGPFRIREAGVIRAVTIPLEGFDPAFPELQTNPSAELHFGISDEGWKVIYADSEYDEQNLKQNLLENGPHPWISGKTTDFPHEVVFDMLEKREIKGFIYTPSWIPGLVQKYELYTGDSPDNVNTPVGTGSFQDIQNMPEPQVVHFEKSAAGRYCRFRMLANAMGQRYASIYRLEIIS